MMHSRICENDHIQRQEGRKKPIKVTNYLEQIVAILYLTQRRTLFCDIKSFGGRIKCPVHSAKEIRFKWLLTALHVLG